MEPGQGLVEICKTMNIGEIALAPEERLVCGVSFQSTSPKELLLKELLDMLTPKVQRIIFKFRN